MRLVRPRYADVAATLALVIALGGTSYAVTKLPANSVGTKQLKNNAVTTKKLAKHAVGGLKLKLGAVKSSTIANKSVGVVDLQGADVTGVIDIPAVNSDSCALTDLTVPGAEVGDIALFSFDSDAGDVAVPTQLIIAPVRVLSAGHVVVKECNPTATNVPETDGVGIRVISLR
jgi:hypothetical protein